MKKKIKKDTTILIATHNPGKSNEFNQLFRPLGIKTIFSNELNIKEPRETGLTFEENSKIKAMSGKKTGYITLADDSGLCVKSLNNEPGIYSARWAKKYGGWLNAMKEIYRRLTLQDSPDLSVKYCCCLTILWKDNSLDTYYGEVDGKFSWPPKGNNGFGYDPIFLPNNYSQTFGEMNKEKKMLIDHRYKAFLNIKKNHL